MFDRRLNPVIRSVARHACTALILAPALLGAQSKRPMNADDLMRVRGVGGAAIAPNGSRVLYTISAWEHPNAKGDVTKGDTALGERHERRSHVWIVPFAGGNARQLTSSERGESQPQWSPDGSIISFVSARGTATGDDGPRPQIWLLNADGGEGTQLTNARDGIVAYSWSPVGKQIAYITARPIVVRGSSITSWMSMVMRSIVGACLVQPPTSRPAGVS